MTIESTINKNRYIGNGATTQFPFTFKIWKTDQILVYVGDGTTEQEVSAQCTIENTVSGGNVTFQTAPASGTIIVLRRNMPYIQEDDYRNGTRFDSEEIEDRFDQDCAERQDLRLDIGRALKVPLTAVKTPEEYEQDFWDAYADNQTLHDEVVGLHADMVAEHGRIADERADALQAVQNEGDHQVQRVQGAADSYYAQHGTGCMELNWTLNAGVPANSDIDIDPLWYIVGRHHMQVSVNGVRQYISKQFAEKGDDGAKSHVYTTLVDLNAGDTINVWITHLAGAITASAEEDGPMSAEDKERLDSFGLASTTEDGFMSKEDKSKLDGIASSTSFARTTTVAAATISAGTAISVPAHAVGQGLLLVWHNGVLCEAGTSAQYVDVSSTSIAFNYNIPAGDTITAAAVDVSAS